MPFVTRSPRPVISLLLCLILLTLPPSASARTQTRSLWLTIDGAARQVGGSCFLLDADGEKVLLDCGSTFDAEDDSANPAHRAEETRFPFDPASISAVLLSHVHLDHVGRLPLLFRLGFRGPVHATRVTRDLARIQLPGCYRYGDLGIETFYTGTRGKGRTVHSRQDCKVGVRIKSRRPVEARRSELEKQGRSVCAACAALEADELLKRFVVHPYHQSFAVTSRMDATLLATGHLPGSAMTVLELRGPSGVVRVAWSGDYGGGTHPFLKSPEPLREADVLLVESTYGSDASPETDPVPAFQRAVAKALRQGHRVLIPAFVLDRTQRVLAALGSGMQKGVLPRVPVLVSSPTAEKVSQAYLGFSRDRATYGESFRDSFFSDPFHGLSWKRLPYRVKALPDAPSIVVASSADGRFGACHDLLPRYAADARATIVTVGWCATSSPTGRLLDASARKAGSVSLEDGSTVALRATVEKVSLSGHGRASTIGRLAEKCRGLRTLILVHGEPTALEKLAAYVRPRLPRQVRILIPRLGERIRLI